MLPEYKKLRTFRDEEKEEILARIEALRPWAYSMDFGSGVTTSQGQDPRGKFEKVLKFVPSDLTGLSCLDIPSNNAQLSMLLKDRGADRVVAIELTELYITQARFISEVLGYDLDLHVGDIHATPDDLGQFDYVFCLGLLYHLKDMLGMFSKLYAWTKGTCFMETEILKVGQYDTNTALFIEGRYHSDATNWWIPGIGCVMGMARSAGFRQVEIIDYWEQKGVVSREGIPMQARGIFRLSTDKKPLPAPRFLSPSAG